MKLEDPLVTPAQMAVWENEVFMEKVGKVRANDPIFISLQAWLAKSYSST